ncbi:sensor histidine kinase [Thermohalobacter berrensis]|uniref:histidine kinase n=1 Tax=Thermohalobacter berrensis TaxID=99594 RepID=A0A419SZJ6_9FIRM|nr:ATP-binding protein [Thermohalobacter berrensis]RKD30609.1 two-component sensor histidine kinase [Thermohalobacter berrensis]
MFNRLRTRLTLFILGGTIFSIILVSIISNITLFNKFDLYMKKEQKNRIKELTHLIKESYEPEVGWTIDSLENIATSSLIKNFDIVIRDNKGNVIFTHYVQNNMMRMHIEMMRKMGHSMMGMGRRRRSFLENGEYKSEVIELNKNGEIIGHVEIGYIGPFMVSEREIEFAKGINTSIIFSALISIIIAIGLGAYLSKIISKPIINITKASNDIRNGKLDTRISKLNNINELNELTNSINHLAASLEKQQRLRKRLTSDIAHELRTPLSILQSHIEAIIDGVWEPNIERMTIFKNEVDRLIKLVEQLKYLTDIENHKIELQIEEINLTKLLKEIVESFKVEFYNKQVSLESDIEKDVDIMADRDKIRQVMINIISNALKFTETGGRVNLKLRQDKKNIIIEIEDNGIGIPKEDLPFIFERLYRSEKSRNRKTGGAGIGLTIAKKLVEAHKGKIRVESQEKKGTKFIIILPISS